MKVTKRARRIAKAVDAFVAIIEVPVYALCYMLLPFFGIFGFCKGFVDDVRGK